MKLICLIAVVTMFGCTTDDDASPRCPEGFEPRGSLCFPPGPEDHALAFAIETRVGGDASDETYLEGLTLRIGLDRSLSVLSASWTTCESSQNILNSADGILWSCRQESQGALYKELILQGQRTGGEVSGTFTLTVNHDPRSSSSDARWSGSFLSR